MARVDEGKGVRMLIACGGTGGHLFPGIAVAKELQRQQEGSRILFVTGRRRMEAEVLSRQGFEQASIAVEGLRGRGLRRGMTVLMGLPRSLFQSLSLMKAFAPDAVLGMGAYSAGPICVAARLLGIPSAIHEQNSYPGLTNRILSRVADRIFVSFEDSVQYFGAREVRVTGNPVREEFVHPLETDRPVPHAFTVLAVGGSQGAKAINEAFVEALSLLKTQGSPPQVIHQTGISDYGRVAEEYRLRGLEAQVSPFIEDMVKAYTMADLVVGRAGATTLFELAALGKPSILIPFPYATNNHQEMNARALERAGGAEVILQKDLTGERLALTLLKYWDDPKGLLEMGRQARTLSRPDAAKTLVEQLVKMISP